MKPLTSLLILWLAWVTPLAAQGRNTVPDPLAPLPSPLKESDVLKGLSAVDVLISLTLPASTSNISTLDSGTVRNRVELKLRQNGLRVDRLVTPYLLISCVMLQPQTITITIYAFTCQAEVRMSVEVRAPNPLRLYATVWEGTVGVNTAGRDVLSSAFDQRLTEIMEEFLNAWLEANPKR